MANKNHSAISGKFVSSQYVKTHPKTTVVIQPKKKEKGK